LQKKLLRFFFLDAKKLRQQKTLFLRDSWHEEQNKRDWFISIKIKIKIWKASKDQIFLKKKVMSIFVTMVDASKDVEVPIFPTMVHNSKDEVKPLRTKK